MTGGWTTWMGDLGGQHTLVTWISEAMPQWVRCRQQLCRLRLDDNRNHYLLFSLASMLVQTGDLPLVQTGLRRGQGQIQTFVHFFRQWELLGALPFSGRTLETHLASAQFLYRILAKTI